VSVENSANVLRGWELIDIPAKLRFISIEPLLGDINLFWILSMEKIAWIIVGGESGPGCREMDLDWARNIHEDCYREEIAFFMKQDSGPKPGMRGRIPDDLWIQQFPDVNKA